MKTEYTPRPLDTSDVTLPDELLELREALARNVHEVWAAGRWAEGWRYGPVRDEARREHPCMVPYEALPEAERDYDRRTAFETLKTIYRLGWRVEKTMPPSE